MPEMRVKVKGLSVEDCHFEAEGVDMRLKNFRFSMTMALDPLEDVQETVAVLERLFAGAEVELVSFSPGQLEALAGRSESMLAELGGYRITTRGPLFGKRLDQVAKVELEEFRDLDANAQDHDAIIEWLRYQQET